MEIKDPSFLQKSNSILHSSKEETFIRKILVFGDKNYSTLHSLSKYFHESLQQKQQLPTKRGGGGGGEEEEELPSLWKATRFVIESTATTTTPMMSPTMLSDSSSGSSNSISNGIVNNNNTMLLYFTDHKKDRRIWKRYFKDTDLILYYIPSREDKTLTSDIQLEESNYQEIESLIQLANGEWFSNTKLILVSAPIQMGDSQWKSVYENKEEILEMIKSKTIVNANNVKIEHFDSYQSTQEFILQLIEDNMAIVSNRLNNTPTPSSTDVSPRVEFVNPVRRGSTTIMGSSSPLLTMKTTIPPTTVMESFLTQLSSLLTRKQSIFSKKKSLSNTSSPRLFMETATATATTMNASKDTHPIIPVIRVQNLREEMPRFLIYEEDRIPNMKNDNNTMNRRSLSDSILVLTRKVNQ